MATTPPEVEATLARLHSHRNVKGLLILSSETGQVIRYSGAMLEEGAAGSTGTSDEALVSGVRREASSDSAAAAAGSAESATAGAGGTSGPASGVSIHPTVKRYADAVRRIVENSKLGVEELDDQVSMTRAHSSLLHGAPYLQPHVHRGCFTCWTGLTHYLHASPSGSREVLADTNEEVRDDDYAW